MRFHIQPISGNKKTGPIAVSTSSADTCPQSCGLFRECYGKTGPQAIHWRKVTNGERGDSFPDFIQKIKALPRNTFFRHNATGDLMGINEDVDFDALSVMDNAIYSRRLVAWTYTHKKQHSHKLAGRNNPALVVNLSADNVNEADSLIAQNSGLPVVTLLPIHHETDKVKSSRTPAGNLVVTCPATIREDVTCMNCGNGKPLCARNDRRYIVGFPAHGTSKRKANLIATVSVA